MLSRVAENLYWLGRYLERADNVSRMVDVEYHASLELANPSASEEQIWHALLTATGARSEEQPASLADLIVLARDNPNSIRASVARARELARALREHVSREVWEEINELHLVLTRTERVIHDSLYDLCRDVKRRVETVFGLIDNTVLFDDGREWFRCGMYLERADMTSRILDTKYYILLPAITDVGGTLDRIQWTAILKSASAWEAFRKSYTRGVSGPHVAEMLIFNRTFPRSLSFCAMALLRHYVNATAGSPASQRVPVERRLVNLDVDLRGTDIDTVISEGLHEFLVQIQTALEEVDRELFESIFRPLPEHVL